MFGQSSMLAWNSPKLQYLGLNFFPLGSAGPYTWKLGASTLSTTVCPVHGSKYPAHCLHGKTF